MKRKLLNILLMGVLIIGLTGCGKENYTEKQIQVREHFQPWYLSSKMTAGEIYDKALRNQKYTEDEDELVIEGKDKKTGKKIKVYYEFKGDRPDFESMTIDGEDKSYSDWYKYMTSYID